MAHHDVEDSGDMIEIQLDEDLQAFYEARAQAAGRTLPEQLRYELLVDHGLCLPDPGDRFATESREIFHRMFDQSPLKG